MRRGGGWHLQHAGEEHVGGADAQLRILHAALALLQLLQRVCHALPPVLNVGDSGGDTALGVCGGAAQGRGSRAVAA